MVYPGIREPLNEPLNEPLKPLVKASPNGDALTVKSLKGRGLTRKEAEKARATLPSVGRKNKIIGAGNPMISRSKHTGKAGTEIGLLSYWPTTPAVAPYSFR